MNNIGFIGLGAMGSVMSPLLSKAGFEVYGFDIKSTQNIKDVKVVNGGELTKAIKLKGIKTSKSVADLIIKLGGEIN